MHLIRENKMIKQLTEDQVLEIGVKFSDLGGDINCSKWYKFYLELQEELLKLNKQN